MSNITNSIIPIIINNKKPEHIGSGILVKIKKELFILTAAHVVDETSLNDILIPTTDGLKPFLGIVTNLNLPNDITRSNDIIDIAYYRLNKDWDFQFDFNIEPLDLCDINITDIPYENDNYAFIGYPAKKSKIEDSTFSGKILNYSGGYIKTVNITKFGFNPETNIVINFDRKKGVIINGHNEQLPLPNGISGGGIFAYAKDKTQNSKDTFKLVGICHTYIPEKKIMIGTKINILIAMIIKTNPDLFESIDDFKEQTKKGTTPPLIVGFAYYKKEQWNEIRNIMVDKENMAEDWEEWRLVLERGLTEHFNKGFQVLRIVLDINELLEYCSKNKVPLDGKARSGLVSHKLADMVFQREIKFVIE